MDEVWVNINDFYQVSTIGRVRSIDRIVRSKNNSTKLNRGKILKPCISNSNGYLSVKIGYPIKTHYVHKLVANHFIPNPENKRCTNHKNGIKTDNRVENLEWATHSENTQHSYNTGLQVPLSGANHWHNKRKQNGCI